MDAPPRPGVDAAPPAFVGALGPLLPPLDPRQPRSGLEAALRLAAACLAVFPMTHRKRPAIKRWQYQATTDPAMVAAWWGPGGRFRDYGVGVALRQAGLLVVDPDTPEAAEGVARLAGDGVGAGWAVASAKGTKTVYRRPARLAQENGAKVAQEALGGCDLVMGSVLAWAPGRTWHGDPGDIGEAPAWLLAALGIIYPDRPTLAPSLHHRPARPAGDGDRLTAYVLRAIHDEADQLARLGDGRKMGTHAAACRLAGLIHLAPDLEGEALAELEHAVNACGLGLRAGAGHLANGWRWGLEHPRPAPPARELGLGALPPDERATLEARAEAATADLVERLRAAGVNWARTESARRLALELVRRCLERGADTVAASCAELGRDIGAADGTVNRAVEALEAIGWTVAPGGIGAGGRAKATRWTLPSSGAPGGLSLRCNGLQDGAPGGSEHPLQQGDKPPAHQGAAGLLGRGLRREVDGVRGCGQLTFRALEAMRDGRTMTAADLAEAIDCGLKAATRMGEQLAAHRVATVEIRATAGRPARAWALTAEVVALLAAEVAEALGAAVAATLTAGARVFMRAQERLEAGRRYLAEAREYARQIGASVRAVLKAWRDRDRRRAVAERDPLRDLAGSAAVAAARLVEARTQLHDGAARWSWARGAVTA